MARCQLPTTHHAKPNNRVKPIIQELTRKVKRGLKMKYNLSEIMHKAWKLYRKGVGSFAEALHRAWNSAKAAPINAQRIAEAQQAAGITEPVNTWAGWKAAGYMVEHGVKALFQAVLIHSSKGDGQTYRASFFGASQVKPLEVQ